MKFLARLLVLLIVLAGLGYLLFPIVSDQYMLHQNELNLRVYRQRASSAEAVKAKKRIVEWNNQQLRAGIVEADEGDEADGGAEDRAVPWAGKETLARLAEKMGLQAPKEEKDRLMSLLTPEKKGLTPEATAAEIQKFARAGGSIQPLTVDDPFTANSDSASALLFTDRNGAIGILEIPKIGLTLPVYNERTASHLESGLFWGPGSSMPIGGAGTHALLAGSGGLPAPDVLAALGITGPDVLNAIGLKGPKLLEDMNQLSRGDLFLFSCMDQTLVYQVERVASASADQPIILERNISNDRMTLVSETRDGGRLIVQGTRIDPAENGAAILEENAASVPPDWATILILGAPVMALGLLVMFIVERVKHRRYRLPTEKK